MAKSILRGLFAVTKRGFSHISDDPDALHKAIHPVCGLLGYLPGRAGAYWRQVADYMNKNALAQQAVREFEEVLAQIDETSICVDLGANIGSVTRRLAETGAIVHSFEPDPWTYKQLETNTHDLANVQLYNAAVAAQDGEITMYRPPGFDERPGAHSVAVSMYNSYREGDVTSVNVACINFCRFVSELEADVDLVKIDIEGAEVELLEALLESEAAKKIKNIFVETHYNIFPDQIGRVAELKRRYANLDSPHVNFNWP